MTTKLTLVAALAAVLALGVAEAASARTFFGVVGPGMTITLENRSGTAVTRIKARRHTIKVDDNASIHNFHLLGQGINKKTGIRFVGERTWRLTFAEGRYRYRCDPHRAHMRGSFRAVA